MEGGSDWRNQLKDENRMGIINKMAASLKKRLPSYDLSLLTTLAANSEENIYVSATSRSDYLFKLNQKLATVYKDQQAQMQRRNSTTSLPQQRMAPQGVDMRSINTMQQQQNPQFHQTVGEANVRQCMGVTGQGNTMLHRQQQQEFRQMHEEANMRLGMGIAAQGNTILHRQQPQQQQEFHQMGGEANMRRGMGIATQGNTMLHMQQPRQQQEFRQMDGEANMRQGMGIATQGNTMLHMQQPRQQQEFRQMDGEVNMRQGMGMATLGNTMLHRQQPQRHQEFHQTAGEANMRQGMATAAQVNTTLHRQQPQQHQVFHQTPGLQHDPHSLQFSSDMGLRPISSNHGQGQGHGQLQSFLSQQGYPTSCELKPVVHSQNSVRGVSPRQASMADTLQSGYQFQQGHMGLPQQNGMKQEVTMDLLHQYTLEKHQKQPTMHSQPLTLTGISQHQRPQSDRRTCLTPSRTPWQPEYSSPLFVPSPPTPSKSSLSSISGQPSPCAPLDPSPLPGDKIIYIDGCNEIEQPHLQDQIQKTTECLTEASPCAPLELDTSALPGLQDDIQTMTEHSMERLNKAVNLVSNEAFRSSVIDMKAVMSLNDLVPKPYPITSGKRMKYSLTPIPVNDYKTRPRIEDHKYALSEEIEETNRRLVETLVDEIEGRDVNPDMRYAAEENGPGTFVKLTYNALNADQEFSNKFRFLQLLFVPESYPNCSPVVLDEFPFDEKKECEDLSHKVRSKLERSLRSLSMPMSLKDMTRTWDACARALVFEYAQQRGGGNFSSKYGTWKICA